MKKIDAEMLLKDKGPRGAAATLNASRLSTPRILRKPKPATDDFFLTIGLHSQIEGEETADDWRVLALQKSAIQVKPLTGEVSCDVVFIVTEEGVELESTIANYVVVESGHGTGWYTFPDVFNIP